ncbi:MAG: hypothetical protein GY940_15275 [bacterium]|nr:hypothetical protein [bacterium]
MIFLKSDIPTGSFFILIFYQYSIKARGCRPLFIYLLQFSTQIKGLQVGFGSWLIGELQAHFLLPQSDSGGEQGLSGDRRAILGLAEAFWRLQRHSKILQSDPGGKHGLSGGRRAILAANRAFLARSRAFLALNMAILAFDRAFLGAAERFWR